MKEIIQGKITCIEESKGSGMDLSAITFAYAMRQATIKFYKNKYCATGLAGKTAYIRYNAKRIR
jgi:hypothetical protein